MIVLPDPGCPYGLCGHEGDTADPPPLDMTRLSRILSYRLTGTPMQSAEKISITLPPDMLRLIREAVAAGEYASTSEALRDAVRAWQRQRLEDAERLAALRARTQASLADPAPSLSEAEVDARLAALFAASGAGDATL
jgi:antitoxin ParD1/3/4